ncbi:hypothetical protein EVG20_g6939 [Dentipellis fragilis]|uniref:Uncharacterized protein n=1 Tax=Dentipellis fragilis TaxID=205917 RepID=A0A4Y9YIU6_9AGAM|nr:hypothetical protein EVG20_g6939 [Dentipellis fragilis]
MASPTSSSYANMQPHTPSSAASSPSQSQAYGLSGDELDECMTDSDEFSSHTPQECEEVRNYFTPKVSLVVAKTGIQDTYCLLKIPDSPYSIRFWDGGSQEEGVLFLDLVDTTTHQVINSHGHFQLYIVLEPGVSDLLGPLKSWEEDMGYRRGEITPGEEQFSVLEGITYSLERDDEDDFVFQVPFMFEFDPEEAKIPEYLAQATFDRLLPSE